MTHRYALGALLPDFLRGGFGLAVAAVLLIFTNGSSVLFYIGVGTALLFGAYVAGTIRRGVTTVTTDQSGLRAEWPGFGTVGAKHIGWGEVQNVAVRYFSTRRDRSNGWMQLTVSGPRARLRIDSTLDAFDVLAITIADIARERGLDLDAATVANLQTIRDRARRGAGEPRNGQWPM